MSRKRDGLPGEIFAAGRVYGEHFQLSRPSGEFLLADFSRIEPQKSENLRVYFKGIPFRLQKGAMKHEFQLGTV